MTDVILHRLRMKAKLAQKRYAKLSSVGMTNYFPLKAPLAAPAFRRRQDLSKKRGGYASRAVRLGRDIERRLHGRDIMNWSGRRRRPKVTGSNTFRIIAWRRWMREN